MTVLTALQAASQRLVGYKPTTFFGSSETFESDLCDLVNEVATDAAEYRDWQALVRVETISGDGVQTAFDLPADYARMMVNSEIMDGPSWLFGYTHIADMNEFIFLQERGFQPTPGAWAIYGDRLNFTPAPSSGQMATFPYVSKNWARPDGGNVSNDKPAFDSDTDNFLLPERLLTLGIVWKWRQNKKMDYTGDDIAYSDALSFYGSKDAGSNVIRMGARLRFGNVPLAWPWTLG